MNRHPGHPFPLDVERSMSRIPSTGEMPGIWAPDGSLRDIYVHRTTLADWQWLLDRVLPLAPSYAFNGTPAPLPSAVEIFSDRSGGHLLSFNVGAASLHCHFFIADEIEIDIAPREVDGEAAHESVMTFVAELAVGLKKPASITPENSPEIPFAVFLPDASVWLIKH